MVFYKIKIGDYEMRYTPLKAEVKEFPYCDKDGNILTKIIPPKVESEKTYFTDDKGNKLDNAYRLIKGKARAKLSKTKIVNSFVEIEATEVEDLLTEKFYFVDCPLLLEKLKKENRAIKFAFTNGNGYKVYLGYVHTSKIYPNCLFMSLGQIQKSKIINEMKAEIEKTTKRVMEVETMEVDRATAEDLLEIEI